MDISKRFLIGDVLFGNEAAFLRFLAQAFPEVDTRIFANFQVGQQQVDFFVVTPTHAGLVELKNFNGPIFGEINGEWELVDAAGNRVPYGRPSNPIAQALKQAYALSDAMRNYGKRSSVPDADRGQYFRNFKTYVAIAPKIHAASVITPGNSKVRVTSPDDMTTLIRSHGLTSTWSVDNWVAFGTDFLNLRSVSLEEAIDPHALEASNTLERYRERSRALIGTNLPPLLVATEANALYGEPLVDRLAAAGNVLLVGQSGSTKTFHVQHATIAMLQRDEEVPILLEAKRYRGGDFWPFLRACLAPLFPGDPKHLVNAIAAAGKRAVLLIDALNECSAPNREDLLKGIIAFALQYEARIIMTTQVPLTIAGITAELITMSLPEYEQRRQIYAFHANLSPSPNLDRFCGSFRNAYELTIAGRCHAQGRPPLAAIDLYDRYISQCLPTQHHFVAAALIRQLANEMSERGSLYLTRNECEKVSSRFLEFQGAPLTVLDDLIHSRLINATVDLVSFEHELLFKQVRSCALEQACNSITVLCDSLQLPRNRDLIEFVMQRLETRSELEAVIAVCDDVSVLAKGYDGSLGDLARTVILDACEAFTERAVSEISSLEVCLTPRVDFAPHVELRGFSQVNNPDRLLAELIALKDSDTRGRERLLQIVDEADDLVWHEVAQAAKWVGAGPRGTSSELLRFNVGYISSAAHPRSMLVLSNLAKRVSSWGQPLLNKDLVAALMTRSAVPNRLFALFLMISAVENRSAESDGATLVTLIERGWKSRIHHIQMTALHTLFLAKFAVDAAGAETRKYVHDFLDRIESNDLILSTLIVEAQAHYGTISPLISSGDALSEMRSIIAWNVTDELEAVLGPNAQSMSAHGTLSRIFDGVFQDAYSEAYEKLSDDERLQILSLAATSSSTGFCGSWIIQELRRLDRLESLPVFANAAAELDLNHPFFQDEIAVFVNAINAFSQYAETPLQRRAPKSDLEAAWFLIADALFWAFHDEGRYAAKRGIPLLTKLKDGIFLSAAAVLSDLRSSRFQIEMGDKSMPTIESVYPIEACQIASNAIIRRAEARRLYIRFGRGAVLENAIRTLGEHGTLSAVPTLRSAINDASVGVFAIKAIQDIEARAISVTDVRTTDDG